MIILQAHDICVNIHVVCYMGVGIVVCICWSVGLFLLLSLRVARLGTVVVSRQYICSCSLMIFRSCGQMSTSNRSSLFESYQTSNSNCSLKEDVPHRFSGHVVKGHGQTAGLHLSNAVSSNLQNGPLFYTHIQQIRLSQAFN